VSQRPLPLDHWRLRPLGLAQLVLRFLQSIVAGIDVAWRSLDPRLPPRPGFVAHLLRGRAAERGNRAPGRRDVSGQFGIASPRPDSRCRIVAVGATALLAATTVALAQGATGNEAGRTEVYFSLGNTFVFLFVALGPLKVLGPFSQISRGHDAAFKRHLAFTSIIIAAIATLAAATLGAMVLRSWGISVGALLLTTGILLFLIALRPVLEQYTLHALRPDEAAFAEAPQPTADALAFAPLAFPTIVTPYGIAVVVLLVTLADGDVGMVFRILGMIAVVMLLNLLAMLYADRILKMPFVAPALGILGAVMAVLQVALGAHAIMTALHLLGVGGAQSG
jgi:multiple antibiotic resistance protein